MVDITMCLTFAGLIFSIFALKYKRVESSLNDFLQARKRIQEEGFLMDIIPGKRENRTGSGTCRDFIGFSRIGDKELFKESKIAFALLNLYARDIFGCVYGLDKKLAAILEPQEKEVYFMMWLVINGEDATCERFLRCGVFMQPEGLKASNLDSWVNVMRRETF